MTYWVIRHAFAGDYVRGYRRWGSFDDAKRFATQDAAKLYADSIHHGVTQVLAVEETAPEHLNIPEVLTDWFSLQIQHRQGRE